MASHRSAHEITELRGRAAELRSAGVGAKRIAQQLGITHHLAEELLKGVPVPASLTRLRAKDDLREAATALRREGRTYDEIQSELGVSKGSLSLWLRELAHPAEDQREAVRSGTARAAPLDAPPDAEIARAVSHVTVHGRCRGLPVPPGANRGRTPEEKRARARRTLGREECRERPGARP